MERSPAKAKQNADQGFLVRPPDPSLPKGGGAIRGMGEKFAAVQMIDVYVPTTDGRELSLTRYTQPEPELKLLLDKLKLTLPAQAPPKITAAELAGVVQTF